MGRGVFFPMAPSEDGERAERLTNTLFCAKDGGDHGSAHDVDEFASHDTTLRPSYGFMSELTVY